MAALMSFHAENCCHLVSEHEVSGQRQFLIGSTFCLLKFIPCPLLVMK